VISTLITFKLAKWKLEIIVEEDEAGKTLTSDCYRSRSYRHTTAAFPAISLEL